MIRELPGGKFRLYSRKKIRAPESAGTWGRSPRGERRYCTSVRSSFSSGTETQKPEDRLHPAALAMVRNAEFLFTAIEDQRNDKILFIIKMPDQAFE